ncbi:jg27758, partial [Pararge aegeria aegeria]
MLDVLVYCLFVTLAALAVIEILKYWKRFYSEKNGSVIKWN